MKDKYFGAHEFQARDEVVKISSERGFGLVFAAFFALLGALSVYNGGERWHYWIPLAALFVVLKGPARGTRMTPAGLRSLFRHHRQTTSIPLASSSRVTAPRTAPQRRSSTSSTA